MPRKHIPQHELIGWHSQPEQRAPNDASRRLGKTARGFLRSARTPRRHCQEKIALRRAAFTFQEDSFGSHRDTGKMAAPIAERLSYERQPRFADSLRQVRPQLIAPDARSLRAKIVRDIGLPPRIENGTTRGGFQKLKKPSDGRHFLSAPCPAHMNNSGEPPRHSTQNRHHLLMKAGRANTKTPLTRKNDLRRYTGYFQQSLQEPACYNTPLAWPA
jgi:hypothetical protein